MPKVVKKCGTCGNLLATKKFEKDFPQFQSELPFGKCELTGKRMSGGLLAGCHFWNDRNKKVKEVIQNGNQ